MAFRDFPELPEGDLAKLRAAIVNMTALADVARDLDLDVLRFGIDPVKSEVSLAEFVAERRLRKM